MYRSFALVAILLTMRDAPAQEKKPLSDIQIEVFRHHPAMIDSEERMEAKKRDEKIILKTVENQIGSYTYEGNLGRGYVLSIFNDDLAKWKQEIDKLHKAGTLKYYDHWGLDKHGFGLIALSKK